MAYGIKYQFSLESINGSTYTVNISKDGYSGSVIKRPLGKSPVLTKSSNGCIHSTTLDLVLECHVDGEYSEFYNATPGDYLVALFKDNLQIWQGSLVTELYSAPEIAPPYDVKISANDGIALTKEFLYEPQGAITPKNLIKNLLSDVPNLGRSIYIISEIGATNLTSANFWNTALINLDYKVGETKYDVLSYFLGTIHATITLHNGNWLIARETDVSVSGGAIPCLLAARNSSSISSTSITDAVQSAGQMGVATLWPIGHMSTTISPAKRRVTIEAPYHVMSGAPSVADNGWSIYDSSHATFLGGTYLLTYAVNDNDYGEVYAQIPVRSFTKDLRLSIRVSTYLAYVYTNQEDLKIYVTFTPTGGSPMYYNGLAWSTSSAMFANPELTKPVGTVETPEDFSFDISPSSSFAGGVLDITFVGRRVRLYDATLETIIGKGHKDIISINNGARGDGDTVEIAGARVTGNDVVSSSFLQGIFLMPDSSPAENFVDSNFTSGLSFMSLTAMGYALSVALPRLELSGTFNVPSSVSTVPLVVTYGGVNYWVESYELDVLEEELRLTARSLPSATLSVESETITELPDEEARGSSSSSGGGGGGSYTLPIASASTLGGVKVGSGLSIDSSTGVMSASGGSTVSVTSHALSQDSISKIATVTVNGVGTDIYNDAAWGTESTSTKTIGLKINGTTKTLMTGVPLATSSAIGGVKLGYTQSGKNYPLLLDTNNKAYVYVPWEATSIDGVSRKAPELVIYRGFNERQLTPFAPYLQARHPAIGTVTGAEFVLMVMSPRRMRNTGARLGKARKSWGAALGSTGEGGLTFTDQVTLLDLRTYILQNYVSVYGQSTANMTYATYQSLTGATGFGHPNGTEAYYRKKIRRSRVFGIAVRWQNPAFSEIASGPLSDHTTEIQENGVSYQRWIYSDVAPIRVFAEISNLDGVASHNGGVIGFQLLP